MEQDGGWFSGTLEKCGLQPNFNTEAATGLNWTDIPGVGTSAHAHFGTSGFPKWSFSCVVRWESKGGGPASSPAFGEGSFINCSV